MSDFQRNFPDELLLKLKRDSLFLDKLSPDIRKGKVFPAVRRDYMSFYYAKNSLFKYDQNGFSTHIKYAFVPEDNPEDNNDYVYQDRIRSVTPVQNFTDGYEKIKDRCWHYAGVEDHGVAELFKFSTTSESNSSRYCFIDTEIVFSSTNF